ncbi:MAG: 5'/3'-nucleotidase SurE [Nitratireductor sp.]|nr:5'/3'-nucleotidase SurE [Nitratireductor sp.]
MRILITNDDGIHAAGLEACYRIARSFTEDVWICAPETDQSGLAHSLTLSEPLRLRKVTDKRFALKGTPTDCVIMAVREILPEPPDLILSGVNSGQNISDDVTYSGTVAGAIEGALLDIRSIALSQAYSWEEGLRTVPWETAEAHAPAIIEKLLDMEFPRRTCVNVNFPNCPPDEIAGLEVTRQGTYSHGLFMDKRRDGRGFPYYWLRFGREREAPRDGTDIKALAENRISVTPLKLDLTDDAFGASLRSKF